MGSELAVQETALRNRADLVGCIRKSNKFTELTATYKTILHASRRAGRRVAGDFLSWAPPSRSFVAASRTVSERSTETDPRTRLIRACGEFYTSCWLCAASQRVVCT